MALGFEHFKGCKSIEHIILNRCKHMENEALEKLSYVKHSLNELQITNCPNVMEDGLLSLKKLNNLKKLTIYNFMYIKDFPSVVNQLKKDLPSCEILTENQWWYYFSFIYGIFSSRLISSNRHYVYLTNWLKCIFHYCVNNGNVEKKLTPCEQNNRIRSIFERKYNFLFSWRKKNEKKVIIFKFKKNKNLF